MFFHCSVLRFWIIVLKLHVLKIVLVSIMSIILILLALCGRHSFDFLLCSLGVYNCRKICNETPHVMT